MDQDVTHAQGLSNVDAAVFAKLMTDHPDAQIIDVRTEFEFAGGHIPNARLYDLMDPEWPNRIDELDRDGTYLLYCRSGNRSYQAGLYMEQLGFTRVFNLAEGIIGWAGDVTTD